MRSDSFDGTPLLSHEDASVNFVSAGPDGISEFRFVQRDLDYFIVYLSTHMGCNKHCRFCHLTQTGQTNYTKLTLPQITDGAARVLNHYDRLVVAGHPKAERIHFNFMARGEPLEASVWNTHEILDILMAFARARNLQPRINISTIVPKTFSGDLSRAFPKEFPITLYYSCYSADKNFRDLWLPNAKPMGQAVELLRTWQQKTGNNIVLHWAFIAGENDSTDQVDRLLDAVKTLRVSQINLVRYNPYSPQFGEEPAIEQLETLRRYIARRYPDIMVRLVPRVGFDVKASCGMFVTPA